MMAGLSLSSGGLQGADISNGEERIVVLAKGDLLAIELLLDEVVTVEVIRRLEGKERRHTHDHGTEDFIADRSEEHTSELQSRPHLVCRLLLEKKNKQQI